MRHEDLIKQMTAKQKAAFLTGKMNGNPENIRSLEFPVSFSLTGRAVCEGRKAREITWD